jgi:hypothetical protein
MSNSTDGLILATTSSSEAHARRYHDRSRRMAVFSDVAFRNSCYAHAIVGFAARHQLLTPH